MNKDSPVNSLSLKNRPDPDRCISHDKKIKYICWGHQVKICSKCVIFGEHKRCILADIGIRDLNDLNQEIGPRKQFCEDLLSKVGDFGDKVERIYQEQRKLTLKVIQDRFRDIQFILNVKEAEFIREISSSYDEAIDKLRLDVGKDSLTRDKLIQKIEEYQQITQSSSPFELLQEDLSSILGLIEKAVRPEKIFEIEKLLHQIQLDIDLKLNAQFSSLEKIGVPTEYLTTLSETTNLNLHEKISPKQETRETQKNLSYSGYHYDTYPVRIDGDILRITTPCLYINSIVIDLLKNAQKISEIHLDFYDSIERIEKENILALCFMRNKLKNIQKIRIHSFSSISDFALLDLLLCLFRENDLLTRINFDFPNQGCFWRSIEFLSETILPSAKSLTELSLNFWQTSILGGLDSLSQNLTRLAQNLTSLHLLFSYRYLKKNSFQNLFVRMPNLREFTYFSNSKKFDDEVLETFISKTLSSLQQLTYFKLLISETKVTDLTVKKLFEQFPHEWLAKLEFLEINLSNTEVTNESFHKFLNSDLQKMISLTSFDLNVENTKVTSNMMAQIKSSRKYSGRFF